MSSFRPLINCHICLIFATPLMGDEPPPGVAPNLCPQLTHTSHSKPPLEKSCMYLDLDSEFGNLSKIINK